MKKFWGLFAVCLVWVACVGAAREATEEEIFERTLPLKPGGLLTLENENGGVTVRSWDRNEVKIWAKKKAYAHDEEEAAELLKEVEIRVDQTADRIDILTDRPRRSSFGNRGVNVTYEITVPKEISLELDTVNGGVEVEEITGTVQANTTNGGVEVRRVRGAVQARTTNGGIEAELLSYNGRDDLTFTTTNGSIRVTFPKDIKAHLEARTTNGHIETDFPITVQGRFSQKSIEGDLNGGGGPLIRLKTTNGSIFLLEAFGQK
ncbi:MAG: DUF4097 family beta strand repeat protein [Candidatus Latescibacteria bacterium]|nr:DUF4097 family beta strand repeat protein [Candidatus Latescibacterota bacterium]